MTVSSMLMSGAAVEAAAIFCASSVLPNEVASFASSVFKHSDAVDANSVAMGASTTAVDETDSTSVPCAEKHNCKLSFKLFDIYGEGYCSIFHIILRYKVDITDETVLNH